MNRNTLFGTLGVSLLLVLMGLVGGQTVGSINSAQSNKSSPQNTSMPERKASVLAQDTEFSQTHQDNASPRQSKELTNDRAIASTQMSQLANASNRFGFNLFVQLQNQPDSAENILISPNSVAIALAMLRNGTSETTKEELTSALELTQQDANTIDLSYQKLIEALKTADPKVKLAIANSLWIDQDITLKPDFINTAQEFYQAEVTNLDFADFQTKNQINSWVAKNTANKITEIIDSVSPEDRLYLINAIYFKGIWTQKFDANATVEQPFYLNADSSIPKMMMNQQGDYRYYENENFQAIRLPYGEKEELGMYIFLPQETSNLAEFNQQLNLDNWQEWLSHMRSRSGKITLPRFQLEYETDLREFLSNLGIKQIFNSSQADFSAMTDVSVSVDNVKHKTFIEVNEEGTEAAAVTSIGIRITSVQPQDMPFTMNVNRPFFFAIRDDITETILFMGSIVEP